jgi:hypothetical protein
VSPLPAFVVPPGFPPAIPPVPDAPVGEGAGADATPECTGGFPGLERGSPFPEPPVPFDPPSSFPSSEPVSESPPWDGGPLSSSFPGLFPLLPPGCTITGVTGAVWALVCSVSVGGGIGGGTQGWEVGEGTG